MQCIKDTIKKQLDKIKKIDENTYEEDDILMVDDHPCEYNRLVPAKYFNCQGCSTYALGPKADREAVLLFNSETELTPEKTIEYFI